MRATRLAAIAVRFAMAAVLLALHQSRPAWEAAFAAGPWLGRGVDIALWLVVASLAVNIVNALVWERIVHRAIGMAPPRLMRETFAYLVYAAAIAAIAAMVFQRSLTAFWAASGAAGVVIGLALRPLILDLVMGVAFSVERSFRMGDYLELSERGAEHYGQVVGMTWRTTQLEMEDARLVIVPHSRMGQLIVSNFTAKVPVRTEVLVTLDPSVPLARATRVLTAAVMAAAQTGPILQQPRPQVLPAQITANGTEFRVRFWQDVRRVSPTTAQGLVLASVLRHLEAADIAPARALTEMRLMRTAVPDAPEVAAIGHIELFASTLTPEERETLSRSAIRRTVPAGEVLIRQGEAGSSMFVLAEGCLAVLQESDGEALQVAVVEPSQVVGEMSLLTGAPRSATVKAIADSVVYEVTAEGLAPLLSARPDMAQGLSEVAAQRARANAEAMAARTGEKPPQPNGSLAAQILERIRHVFDHPGRA